MIGFKEFSINEDNYVRAVIELATLMSLDSRLLSESTETLEESVKGMLDKTLHKSGIHVSKSIGLIGYMFKGAKGMAQMFIAAAKGDKEKVKEISKSVKKEHILDLLMKLDQASLHVLTGPNHLIDAVTGYHIGVDMKNVIVSNSEKLKAAISSAKAVIIKSVTHEKIKSKMMANIERLMNLIPSSKIAESIEEIYDRKKYSEELLIAALKSRKYSDMTTVKVLADLPANTPSIIELVSSLEHAKVKQKDIVQITKELA